MLYAAKCYWPGVTQADLEQVAERAMAGLGTGSGSVIYLGSLLFAADDLVLCLFQGPTRAAVIQASDVAPFSWHHFGTLSVPGGGAPGSWSSATG